MRWLFLVHFTVKPYYVYGIPYAKPMESFNNLAAACISAHACDSSGNCYTAAINIHDLLCLNDCTAFMFIFEIYHCGGPSLFEMELRLLLRGRQKVALHVQ